MNELSPLTLDEVGLILGQELDATQVLGSPLPNATSIVTATVEQVLERLFRERRIRQVPRFVVQVEGSNLDLSFISDPEDWIF